MSLLSVQVGQYCESPTNSIIEGGDLANDSYCQDNQVSVCVCVCVCVWKYSINIVCGGAGHLSNHKLILIIFAH